MVCLPAPEIEAKSPPAVGVGDTMNVVDPSGPTPPWLTEAPPVPNPGITMVSIGPPAAAVTPGRTGIQRKS